MPQITYVEHDGHRHTVASPVGISLMEAAVMHRLPGIEGDCGGFCACGTCHCYLDAADDACLPAMHDLERATLDFAHDVNARSRLACQIPVTEAMDGIIVEMPARQY